MGEGLRAGDTFWTIVPDGNVDGSLSYGDSAEEAFSSEAAALAYLKYQIREHGLEGHVYRCEAVIEVRRQARVIRIKRDQDQ
jgi:hypothetical protein